MIENIHKMHFNEYSTDIIYFSTYLNLEWIFNRYHIYQTTTITRFIITNYVELFPSKYWLNLHKRGLWNKFKYLMILVSSLVGCKEILEPIIIILVLL